MLNLIVSAYDLDRDRHGVLSGVDLSGRQLNHSMNRRGLLFTRIQGHLLDLIVVLSAGYLASKRLEWASRSAARTQI